MPTPKVANRSPDPFIADFSDFLKSHDNNRRRRKIVWHTCAMHLM